MSPFVDLSRRFRPLDTTPPEDPDLMYDPGDGKLAGTLGWDDLLQRPRVLLLAEAGSGKTQEMQAQVARLKSGGHFAIFVPLEALASATLVNCLAPDVHASRHRERRDRRVVNGEIAVMNTEIGMMNAEIGARERRDRAA